MLTFLLIVVAAAALVGLVIAALTYGGAWRHFRGQRVVVCPENESFTKPPRPNTSYRATPPKYSNNHIQ